MCPWPGRPLHCRTGRTRERASEEAKPATAKFFRQGQPNKHPRATTKRAARKRGSRQQGRPTATPATPLTRGERPRRGLDGHRPGHTPAPSSAPPTLAARQSFARSRTASSTPTLLGYLQRGCRERGATAERLKTLTAMEQRGDIDSKERAQGRFVSTESDRKGPRRWLIEKRRSRPRGARPLHSLEHELQHMMSLDDVASTSFGGRNQTPPRLGASL